MNIVESLNSYEKWLRGELGGEVVERDLEKKRRLMAEAAFSFLRATYWRWAEVAPDLFRRSGAELNSAPRVLAVGDIHLENFGTWRDEDGRLVWGVNDYDEAAEMPYTLDLVRLATSGLVARDGPNENSNAAAIAAPILVGYVKGLERPRPCVLDGRHGERAGNVRQWLRQQTLISEADRAAFWDKLESKRLKFREDQDRPALPERFRAALLASLPRGAEEPEIWPSRAGLGSLGRPRWVARAAWQGGLAVREAKAAMPSAWTRVQAAASRAIRCTEIAAGRHRAPDPWYRVTDGIAVRRLSPNNRKLEADSGVAGTDGDKASGPSLGLNVLLDPKMLGKMGRELAAVHLGTGGAEGARAKDIERDLKARDPSWLARAAEISADAVRRDWEEFKSHHSR